MKKLGIVLFMLGCAATLQAQITKGDPYNVQPTLDVLGEIDSANQILPLILTKVQIKKLLPKIEQCRMNIRNQEKKEAESIKELKPEADKIYAEALEGKLPPQSFLDKVNALYKKLDNQRAGVAIANALILRDILQETLNEGQRKAAIGVVDKIFDAQSKKWTDGTPEQKLQYFALSVLLGDHSYNLLVKLSKS